MNITFSTIKTILAILILILSVQAQKKKCFNFTLCIDGLFIPNWLPVRVGLTDSIIRATVYFIVLLYSFFGVSIIADRFMSAVERITSQEKEVSVKIRTGQIVIIRVRIWNETVSNLTLMALGSSAPEILLSVIEVFGKNFEAGTLGPGTIVGSAAFNLFLIIGLCILVIPHGQNRRIKHLTVFLITATFSVLAYIWLYLIIGVISVGVVEVWEAIVTFLLFPFTVTLAYLADRRFFLAPFGSLRSVDRRNAIHDKDKTIMKMEHDSEVEEFENVREKYIRTFKDLRKRNPTANLQDLENLAIVEVAGKSKKSRAYYKMIATRMLTGGGNLLNHSLSKLVSSQSEGTKNKEIQNEFLQRIYFDPCHYTIMENIGTVSIFVRRAGGYLGSTVYVDYATLDDTAISGQDYIKTSGTLVFLPNEVLKQINIMVVDDDIFEEDEHFMVELSNLKVENGKQNRNYEYEISKTNRATIMILDDDHAGTFYFENIVKEVSESCGIVKINVHRSTGARGCVRVRYKTKDGTAKKGTDYRKKLGELIFANEEISKVAEIEIYDNSKYTKSDHFFVKLGKPKLMDRNVSLLRSRSHENIKDLEKLNHSGLPKLGEWRTIKIIIHENQELKGIIDRLLKKANTSASYGGLSWLEQFKEAFTMYSEKDDENGIDIPPSLISFILHYLTLFWKVLFAFVPPTEYLGGWLCFVVSIICIAILTALLGDLASGFGCSIGLLDEVTAITFVAVGTSLPDTFASKVAAIHDETADASIGNVTGSNAVNVFLGVGIAWSIASIVHAARGTVFHVPIGSLGFSVTLFCVLAFLAIVVILSRRHYMVGGELGGPFMYRYISSGLLFVFYAIYIIVSSLKAYCHI